MILELPLKSNKRVYFSLYAGPIGCDCAFITSWDNVTEYFYPFN